MPHKSIKLTKPHRQQDLVYMTSLPDTKLERQRVRCLLHRLRQFLDFEFTLRLPLERRSTIKFVTPKREAAVGDQSMNIDP